MKLIQLLSLCLISILVYSCSSPVKSVVEKHASGTEKRTIIYLGDTTFLQQEIEFFENGDTARVALYGDDGKSVILENFFYSNGELKQTGAFIDDHRVGVWKAFFETGQLQSIRNYNEQGLEEGVSRVYRIEGSYYFLFMSGYFSQGEKRGTWKIYNRNGDIIKTIDH